MPQRVTADILRRGLRVLGVAIRTERRIFGVAVAGSVVYGLTTVLSAWVMGRVTEQVVMPAFREGRTTAGILVTATAVIIGVALAKVLGIIARRVGAGIMQYRLQARYRHQVTGQYLRLPLSWHRRHPAGELLSNANADVEATWMPIAPLPMAVGVLVMLVAGAGAMFLTDLILALVGLCVFPAIALLNFVYQRRVSPLAARAQQLRAEVSGVAHESFDGALIVKALGREGDETSRFRGRAQELRDANVSVGRVRGLFDPALEAIPNLGVLVVLLVGSIRIEYGAMTAGELVQIAYLFTLLAFPVRALGWVLAELPRSVVGWERVRSVLDAAGSLTYGDAELPRRGAAKADVRDIRFGYLDDSASQSPSSSPSSSDAASHEVLHDVNLLVEPGRTVALVGPTGSGKSTLAGLLVRLMDPGAGAVVLDGVNVREVRHGGVAAAAAIVAQQTFLFDDTVRGNVALGLDVADEEVWAALQLAQADGFVGALAYGLDTQVGERGTSLSGGQRQRIALARALVRRPRLLILDDATSSVDPQVEAKILAGLRGADLPSTVVVVAYRNASIALADEVVFLERGRVSGRGTHAELRERSPGYRRLVTAYEREAAGRRALDSALDSDAEPTGGVEARV